MSSALKKITTRAKQLQRSHPNSKWTSLIKKAGAEYRDGRLGSTKPKASRSAPKRKPARRIAAAAPAPRRKASTGSHTQKLSGVSVGSLKSEIKRRLKRVIDEAVVKKYHAQKKRIKSRYQKKITQAKSQLRKLL